MNTSQTNQTNLFSVQTLLFCALIFVFSSSYTQASSEIEFLDEPYASTFLDTFSSAEEAALDVFELETRFTTAVSTCRWVRGIERPGALFDWSERNREFLVASRLVLENDDPRIVRRMGSLELLGRIFSRDLSRGERRCESFLAELDDGSHDVWEVVAMEKLLSLMALGTHRSQ